MFADTNSFTKQTRTIPELQLTRWHKMKMSFFKATEWFFCATSSDCHVCQWGIGHIFHF